AGDGRPSDCRALALDETGNLWVGSDLNLFAFDPAQARSGSPLPQKDEPLDGKLDFLLSSKHGGYWRFVNRRIEKWQAGRAVSQWPYPWTNTSPTTASEDADGNLVV